MKKALMIVLFFLILAANAQAKEITDLLGRKIKLPEKIDRVVAIGPGALRIVVYLSAVDRIVGVERVEKGGFVPYGRPYTLAIREKIKNLPLIGEGGPGKLPNFEAIVGLKPDLIFAVGFDAETVNMIYEKTKTPIVVLNYGTLGAYKAKEFSHSLKLAASLLGKEKRAEEILGFMKKIEDQLKKRTSGQKERPRVYGGAISFKGQHGITSTQSEFLPFKLADVINVVDGMGKSGHLFIEKERLLNLNPDIIFVDVAGLSIFEKEFRDSPSFFNNLKAVREGKLFTLLPYNYYNTNVELALSDAFFVGKVAYPSSFKDVNIEEEVEKIIRFFVGESVYEDVKKNFGSFGRIEFREGKANIVPLQ